MLVEVKDLVRQFGTTTAVDHVSFEFRSGDVYGFVGPNGAGKTTAMRIMATLDEPTSGDVLFDGTSVINYPEKARPEIGYMPDALPRHRDITVEEYIDFFGRAYGLRGRKKKESVEGVLEFTNLQGIRWKRLRALSKGMQQRVSLARAIVHNPSVLIMDEPAAGLDPRARIELRELLKVLCQQGKAILISSHILTELSEICSGAIIIERGKILRAGSFEHLVESHHGTELQNIVIRVHEMGAAVLARQLLEMPMVDSAEPMGENGGLVRVLAPSGDDAAVALLGHLISQGLPVVQFTPSRADLEDVFMAITEGKVQ